MPQNAPWKIKCSAFGQHDSIWSVSILSVWFCMCVYLKVGNYRLMMADILSQFDLAWEKAQAAADIASYHVISYQDVGVCTNTHTHTPARACTRLTRINKLFSLYIYTCDVCVKMPMYSDNSNLIHYQFGYDTTWYIVVQLFNYTTHI